MDSKQLDLDRTWICCVLFADIASYSMQPVEQQIEWKLQFNKCLSEALLRVAPDERYILDTGDGAAVCFLGAPEPAMHTALKLRDFVVRSGDAGAKSMHIRVGINLGPLRLMKDVNGVVNAIGDAMNVSQRVMSFARPDQILVSRSFHETVSCLSEENARMFMPAGTRTDKNGRGHIVYELGPSRAQTEHSSAFVASPFQSSNLEKLRDLLIPVLGPIAERLINEEAAKSRSMEDLSQRLMAHLPPGPAREFRQRCRAELGEPGTGHSASSIHQASSVKQDPSPNTGDFPDRAKKELARFIGPVARIIVENAVKRCGSKEEVLDLLCQEISWAKDREEFRRSMKQA